MITRGIALATTQGSTFELKDLYLRASELAERTRAFSDALEFRKKFEQLSDSVSGEKSRAHVAMLEARFESDKKVTMIQQLESDKKVQELSLAQQTTLNMVLAGTVVVSATIFFLGYRNYRQKQALQQQQIVQLQNEKQLMATEAVLEGEERERARLAKDLHDGLGGMLSGLKYNLNNMKGNQIMTVENQAAFERSLEMLDKSIREMRRVAHNMMPEALLRFGLDAALRDFCNDITLSHALSVNYQSLGMQDTAIDQTRAITIYRIVQELINNTIRHAGARSAIVQLSRDGEHISLTVEDDGNGFDTAVTHASTGIGWSNIRSRVAFLNGKLDVSSDSAGTSVHIEL
jgi:signal transduction histidine kinase